MKPVQIAAIQMQMSSSIKDNIKKADHWVRTAAQAGANIILLPELFMGPYFCQVEDYANFELATPLNHNEGIQYFQKVAKELGVVLPISYFEKDNNVFYNSIAIIDHDGQVIGHYRKSHIPTGESYEEKFYFKPGDTGFKVFDTKFGKLGVAICWDQWFPEAARIMSLHGAELLLYPTAIGSEPTLPIDSKNHWTNAMMGHAAANLVPVIAANRIGEEKAKQSSMTFYGSSFITNYNGDILKNMDRVSEGYIMQSFDLEALAKLRYSWGVFRDRRPDLYGDLIKK
jgi:N-carbamoylputrescine amidase